jgi:plasmid stabilization system protein ParE
MAHEVLIPPEVAAIGDWIAQDNPAAARTMMERPYRRCLSLDHLPERGRPYGAIYRAVNEGHYVIIYRIDPTSGEGRVVIVAVMHASRDIRRILGIAED